LATVLPHEIAGEVISDLFGSLERSTYNLIFGVAFSLIVISSFVFLLPRIRSHHEQKKITIYFLINCFLSFLCFSILFVVNVEAIHFVQYALFAILCFLLSRNLKRTLLISSLAGFFDELYQYVILAPDKNNYYDFNDVVINIIGVGFGIIFVKAMSWDREEYIPIKNWKSLPEIWVLISLPCIYIIGRITNQISVLQNPENPAAFSLIKVLSKEFWTIHQMPYSKFHILLPLEGLALIALLWCFYYSLCKSQKLT